MSKQNTKNKSGRKCGKREKREKKNERDGTVSASAVLVGVALN